MKDKRKIHHTVKVLLLLTCMACLPVETLNAGEAIQDSNAPHRPVNQGSYYVAIDGNDTSPGTFERPFKTLEKAVKITGPGQTIYIRGGIYHCDKTIFCDKSGEQYSPISILAYQNEKPIFDFSMAWGNGFVIRGAYWHMKGLVVQNAGEAGIVIQSEKAHHNTIEHITVHNNNNTGLSLRSKAADNLILNCDAHHNFDPVSNGEDADGFGAKFGIGPGNVFRYCRAWNNSDDAFDFWYAGAGVRVEDCYGWENGRNVWEHPLFQGNSNGFKLGQLEGDHILIRCVAWDHPGRGFDLNGNSTGVTVHNCTAFRNGTNYAFTFTKGNIEKNVLRNCLSFSGNVRMKSEVDDQYNSWNDSTSVEITKDDFISLDDSAIKGPRSPGGSLPSSSFLKLAASSDAIDAGIDVGLPYNGNSPDLGAFESPPANERPSKPESHDSAPGGSTSTDTQLIEKQADKYGATPLHNAARHGQRETVEMLLAKGTDAGPADGAGRKALHYAARFGHEEIVTLLLARDSTINSHTYRI